MSSYAPGTKLSFKTGRPDRAGDSSVVVLRNGSLLEVRNGKNTFGSSKQNDRQTWANLDEWKATLPPGAPFTVSTSKRPASPSPSAASHHDIERIQNKFREAGLRVPHAENYVFLTLRRPATPNEQIVHYEREIARNQEIMKSITKDHARRNFQIQIDYSQRRIDDLRKDPKPNEEKFTLMPQKCVTKYLILYGERDGNSPQGIYINCKHGKFAIRREDGSPQVASRLEELGFTRVLVRIRDKMIPL